MARYHGRRGVVYMSTTAATAAVPIAHLTEWSLDMPADRVEVTSFDDSNKVYVGGLRDISFSFSGFWDDTEADPFTASEGGEAVKVYLYPASDAATKYWYGSAYVDISINTGVSAAVAISGNGQASGAWGRM